MGKLFIAYIIIIIIVILIIRAIGAWMLRINEIIKLQKQTNELLEQLKKEREIKINKSL